jgi:uncharacterized SAM-binding protein YcdF (DUF218 family)
MKALRLSIGAGAVASVLFILGFVIFANVTTRSADWPLQPADAIVVLTGGEERISEARMLVSEYVKYLHSAVRFAVGRLARQQQAEAITSAAGHRNSKT